MPSHTTLSTFVVLVGCMQASGGLITVGQSGGEDHATIQSAVDSAFDGDTIEVMAGQYTSTGTDVVSVIDKSLTIRAADGELVVIFGEWQRRGVSCVLSGQQVSIDGIVFYGCDAVDQDGGGLQATGTSGTINVTNCTIDTCVTTASGGGVSVTGLDATLTNCTFLQSDATDGGGVHLDQGGADPTWTLTQCEVWDCWTIGGHGAAMAINGGTVQSSSCAWNACDADGDGGALHIDGGADVTMTGDTLKENVAQGRGGALNVSSGSTVALTNCSVRDNTAANGGAAQVDGVLTLSDSTIESCAASSSGGGAAVGPTGAIGLDTTSMLWNTAPSGNDIATTTGSVVALTDCTMQGNGAVAGVSVQATNAVVSCSGTFMCDYPATGHIEGDWTDGGGNTMGAWCCDGDLDASDDVSLPDLIGMLARWGDVAVMSDDREDVDRSGALSVSDLLALLTNWGACDISGEP